MNNQDNELSLENKNKGIIVVVVILFILLLISIWYIVYDKIINLNNSEKVTEETAKTISDTNEAKTSKKISELISEYNLESIIWIYANSNAFNYTDFSKQEMKDISKSDMIEVMLYSILGSEEDYIHYTAEEGNALTADEEEYMQSVYASTWIYVSDFNNYIKNVFKSDIVITEDTKLEGWSCPTMSVYKDKVYLTYQCGFTGGPINNIYTSFVKDENEILLYGIVFKENEESSYTITRVKYTFEYNDSIWDLKEVEPLEVIQ